MAAASGARYRAQQAGTGMAIEASTGEPSARATSATVPMAPNSPPKDRMTSTFMSRAMTLATTDAMI